MKGGAKSRVVTIRISPQGTAYTRALKSEKTLSPPIPVVGGAVDTNDWCIISQPSPGGGGGGCVVTNDQCIRIDTCISLQFVFVIHSRHYIYVTKIA